MSRKKTICVKEDHGFGILKGYYRDGKLVRYELPKKRKRSKPITSTSDFVDFILFGDKDSLVPDNQTKT